MGSFVKCFGYVSKPLLTSSIPNIQSYEVGLCLDFFNFVIYSYCTQKVGLKLIFTVSHQQTCFPHPTIADYQELQTLRFFIHIIIGRLYCKTELTSFYPIMASLQSNTQSIMIGQLSKRLAFDLCLFHYTIRYDWTQTWLNIFELNLKSIVQSLRYSILILMREYHQRLFPISNRMIPIILEQQIFDNIWFLQYKLIIYFSLHQRNELFIFLEFLWDECFEQCVPLKTLFLIMSIYVEVSDKQYHIFLFELLLHMFVYLFFQQLALMSASGQGQLFAI